MIVAIGDWVLRVSCMELARLQALGLPDLRMSVNVSQIQFRHPGFLDKLRSALTDTGINPKCLENPRLRRPFGDDFSNSAVQ